jgi:hypothetical protein
MEASGIYTGWDLLRQVLADALDTLVPTVREVVAKGGSVLVDGFLAPAWDWKHARGMYSDTHGEAGFNIQVARGTLVVSSVLRCL